jgi:transposase InsO family protein
MGRSASCAAVGIAEIERKVEQVCEMRDQLLNGELFYTLKEAQIIIERWRIHYNTVRPHTETIQLAS